MRGIPAYTLDMVNPIGPDHSAGYYYGLKLTVYRDLDVYKTVVKDYYHRTPLADAAKDILGTDLA